MKKFLQKLGEFLSQDDLFNEPMEIEFSESIAMLLLDIDHQLKAMNGELNKIAVELTYQTEVVRKE